MKKEKQPLKLKDILANALLVVQKVSRYRLILFVLLVALIYGFVILKIETLNNAQASVVQIAAQTSPTASAHVDKGVVTQLQKLQDNSVSVQTLFTQARNNPFQE